MHAIHEAKVDAHERIEGGVHVAGRNQQRIHVEVLVGVVADAHDALASQTEDGHAREGGPAMTGGGRRHVDQLDVVLGRSCAEWEYEVYSLVSMAK